MSTSLGSYRRRFTALLATAGVLVLGLPAALAQAAPAPARLTAPPIRESFTHQPCPTRATSTVAMEDCAGDQVLGLDERIDALDTAIMARLPHAGQVTFLLAARQWLGYRNAVARAAASPDAGGTIAPLVALGALASEDRAHITALTAEFRAGERGADLHA